MTAIASRLLAWLIGRPAFAAAIGAGLVLALLAAVSAAGVQTLRLAERDTTIAQLERAAAQGLADRSEAARVASENTAIKENAHATAIQTAVEAFHRGELASLPDLRQRLADTQRLLDTAEDRAARYRAQAAGDAAARERLAHHAAQLDRAIAEGRQLVAELRAAVAERDAQVALLLDVIAADRRLLDSQSR